MLYWVVFGMLFALFGGMLLYGRKCLNEGLEMIGIVITIILIIVFIASLGWSYSFVIHKPYELKSANDTVNEIFSLLSDSNLSNLEDIQLKMKLAEAIKHRNDVIADLKAYYANPFAPLKGILTEKLKDARVYDLVRR